VGRKTLLIEFDKNGLELSEIRMPSNQADYEKLRLANLSASVSEIRRMSATLERAAKVGAPLPVSKEALKSLSLVARECASIVNEHAAGNRVADATLRAVAFGLFDVYDSINNIILYAAVTQSV
jgi:hypothetical protein